MPQKRYIKRAPKARTEKDKSQDRRISRIQKTLSKMSRQDLHHWDVASSNDLDPVTPLGLSRNSPSVITQLCIPTQGDSDTSRAGDKIYVKSLNVKVWLQKAISNFDDMARVMLVESTDGTVPQTTTLFTEALDSANSRNTPMDQRNLAYIRNFRVHYDKTFLIEGSSSTGARFIRIKKSWGKGKGHVIKFEPASTTNAGGQFYLVILAMGQTGITGAGAPGFSTDNINYHFTSRVWFSP